MSKLPKIVSLLFLCNILRKKVNDEVDFFHTDKHESFLQTDFVIFDENDQAFPKFRKQKVCNVFTISQKRS